MDAPLGRVLQLHPEIFDFPEFKATILADEKDGRISFSIPPALIGRTIEDVHRHVVYLLEQNRKQSGGNFSKPG